MPQPPAYQNLIRAFDALPGVGPRAAARFAQYVIKEQAGDALLQAIIQAREVLQLCERCFCLTDSRRCLTCETPAVDQQLVVVADLEAHQALQEAGYSNLFVLHGLLSPSAGIGPSQLKLSALQQRVLGEGTTHLLLAFPAGVEADATEWFITDLLPQVSVTRTNEQLLRGVSE